MSQMPRSEQRGFYSAIGAAAEVACPPPAETLLIIAGGQSNAGNFVSERTPAVAKANTYTLFEGRCFLAQDPMLGADGDQGSLWPSLGAALSQHLGRPIMFIAAAAGGTRYRDWIDPHASYLPRLRAQIEAATGLGYHPSVVIWHQGEADTIAGATAAEVEQDLGSLAREILQIAPSSLFYLYQVSRCVGPKRVTSSQEVKDGQARVAAADHRIVLGFDTDTLDENYRWDKCHFNKFGRDEIVMATTRDIVSILTRRAAAGQ